MKDMLLIDCNDVCRAMTAAAICHKKYGIAVAHAGNYAVPEVEPNMFAVQAAEQAEIDISAMRAVCLSEELLAQAEVIVGVTPSIAYHIRKEYPAYAAKVRELDIQDPFGMGQAAYAACVRALEEQLEVFCGTLHRTLC